MTPKLGFMRDAVCNYSRIVPRRFPSPIKLAIYALVGFILSAPLTGTAQQADSKSTNPGTLPETPQPAGKLSGTVTDNNGTRLFGASITIENEKTRERRMTVSNEEGLFAFDEVSPGKYEMTVTDAGFVEQTLRAVDVIPGEEKIASPVKLSLAAVTENVRVAVSQYELAEEQVKAEEKQRFLGVLPNFYVTYADKPVPLTAGQKFRLALRTTIDPTTFGFDAMFAGIQANDKHYRDYGTGAEGFGKRFGVNYGDSVGAIMLSAAVFPALLNQDPRYYYKGKGTTISRAAYALSYSFRCKGDNGRWQPNYSLILGDFAAVGLSQLYYTDALRSKGSSIVKGVVLDQAFEGAGNLLQEFLFKKVTTNTDILKSSARN